ncbi:MAG: hypothetical protein ACLRZH_13335 [Ruthenibacterium lactatiformans]
MSVNISRPGVVKGNHWHHTKNEKFLVVKGEGVIRFRRLNTEAVYEYRVSGDKLEVVDIPTGYTHNIENVGESDMVTVMWASEPFDPERPDTYFAVCEHGKIKLMTIVGTGRRSSAFPPSSKNATGISISSGPHGPELRLYAQPDFLRGSGTARADFYLNAVGSDLERPSATSLPRAMR